MSLKKLQKFPGSARIINNGMMTLSQSQQCACRFVRLPVMKEKIVADLDAAIADVHDGARIMFGGFGGAGFPNNLIQALARKGTKNITAISNNCGTREGELGLMV